MNNGSALDRAVLLRRAPSEREQALARLEGGASTSQEAASSLLRKPSTGGAPRLSALQRRHIEKQRQQNETTSENEVEPPPDSPDFSIFTPSVVQAGEVAPSRQEARSNLMRKLSKREGASPSPSPLLSQHAFQSSSHQERQEDTEEVIAASPSASEMTSSDFKPYRYTMERDRDSAYARFNGEDQFEYAELLRSESVRSTISQRPLESKRQLRSSNHSELSAYTTPQTESVAEFQTPDAKYQFPGHIVDEDGYNLSRSRSHDVSASEKPTIAQSSTSSQMRRFASDGVSPQVQSQVKSNHQVRANTDRHARAASQKSQTSQKSHSRNASKEIPLQSATKQDRHSLEQSTQTGSRPLRESGTRSPASSARSKQSTKSKVGHSEQMSHSSALSMQVRASPDSAGFRDRLNLDDNSDFEGDYSIPRRSSPTGPAPKDVVSAHLSALLSQTQEGSELTNFDNTPRQLLMHTPVLQVVNAHTVKDRYLFLFSDILLIAKPFVETDPATGLIIPPSLDSNFLVKSIVELDKLKLTAQRDDDGQAAEEAMQKRKSSLLHTFVDRFANNPKRAIDTLVTKGGLANEPPVIANLLFRTPELNRSQLGNYLCKRENKNILKAYVDRFRFAEVRIEDALRIFLATLRLPNDSTAAEYLLSTFSAVYMYANQSWAIEQSLCGKLVLAVMELNDYLHSGLDDDSSSLGCLFGFPNPAITVDDFLSAFRSRDPRRQISDDELARIYLSIRKERLQQAADNSIIAVTPDIPVVIEPARLPSRLTYRVPSELITITLPKADAKFQIRLLGGDLVCEPSILSFAKSRSQSFTITGTVLGPQSLLFLRLGPTCTFYTGLPVNKTFSVERAFMRHTFQLAFVNHLGIKRKYMFSMSDTTSRGKWLDTLASSVQPSAKGHNPNKIAQSVSLQVLRDALLSPEEANSNAKPGSRGATPLSTKANHVRSNSFSKTYAFGSGRAENDIAPPHTLLRPPLAERTLSQSRARDSALDKEAGTKSGHEIVLSACQNSHIPLLLGFLNHHKNGVPHPLAREGTAFRPKSNTPEK